MDVYWRDTDVLENASDKGGIAASRDDATLLLMEGFLEMGDMGSKDPKVGFAEKLTDKPSKLDIIESKSDSGTLFSAKKLAALSGWADWAKPCRLAFAK